VPISKLVPFSITYPTVSPFKEDGNAWKPATGEADKVIVELPVVEVVVLTRSAKTGISLP
jgi:hypothetical protein